MKIKPEHYTVLRDAIEKIPAEKITAHKALLLTDSRVKDQDKRLRWDLLWSTGLTMWVCDTLYPYMDDTHLDTALRSIAKELNL